MPTSDYSPRPEHHFTFGLWTVGNIGRDPFGDPVRPALAPTRIVRQLASLGAYEVSRGEYLARVARATPRQVPALAISAALDGWAERF